MRLSFPPLYQLFTDRSICLWEAGLWPILYKSPNIHQRVIALTLQNQKLRDKRIGILLQNCLSYPFSHFKANFILQSSYKKKKESHKLSIWCLFLGNHSVNTKSYLSSSVVAHHNSKIFFALVYAMSLLNNFSSSEAFLSLTPHDTSYSELLQTEKKKNLLFLRHNDEEMESYLILIDENSRRECKLPENKEIFLQLLWDTSPIC